MSTKDPYERFREWCREQKDQGTPDWKTAQTLGCDPSALSRLKRGTAEPNLETAVGIERATEHWEGGQIRAAEWVGVPAPNKHQSDAA